MPPSKRNHSLPPAFALPATFSAFLALLLFIAQAISCQPPNQNPNPSVPVPQDGEVSEAPSKSTPTPAAVNLIDTQGPATPLNDKPQRRDQQTNSTLHRLSNDLAAVEKGRGAESEPIVHELASTESVKHGTRDNETAASSNATTAATTPTSTSATTSTLASASTTTTTTTTTTNSTGSSQSNSASTGSTSADTSNGTTGVTGTSQSASEKPLRIEVECDNLCLNGGRCVVLETGEMVCQCVVPFFGSRCQHRDICKSIIADQLNGDQICERIGRQCLQDDKLFRCACNMDEFFVFKADYQAGQAPLRPSDSSRQPLRQPTASFAYDSLLPHQVTPAASRLSGARESIAEPQRSSGSNSFGTTAGANARTHISKANANKHVLDDSHGSSSSSKQTYLADCRKIDKCLGVRCRQTSEICQDGVCVCNRNTGYLQDPVDKLCKLLDPCQLPSADGLPRCGQAKCVATYDRELYKCVCPVGYKPVKVGEHRSSIQCALLSNQLCEIPLLNNCQHVCKIDRKANTYKCSCLPGYKPGTRAGIDDNMCFFDEHLAQHTSAQEADGEDYARSRIVERIKTDDQPRPRHRRSAAEERAPNDGVLSQHPERAHAQTRHYRYRPVEAEGRVVKLATGRRNVSIKREPNVETSAPAEPAARPTSAARLASPNELDEQEHEFDYYRYTDLNNMSAQDRCNMYCEPNKICVLEEGSHDSYRCVCDRQGYVSVGDKCLDWCSAAEFSHTVQSLLAEVCYSGLCRPADTRPAAPSSGRGLHLQRLLDGLTDQLERERVSALAKSSWRPSFHCDCSTSPLIFKDPHTNLCKLDFDAILRPCLPGNEGYTDCVINKHAYCSVLHRPTHFFFRDLFAERIFENQLKSATSSASNSSGHSNSAADQTQQQKSAPNKKLRPKEKLYTCVCSPEKKFLVDKPRNKARCIHECDLLNNECGRFNRMCRPATIESSQDFGFNWNLVKFDRDGVRMNQFKRTGCECLPGFNVGPTESRDFTLDDNYPEKGANYVASFTSGVWPPSPDVLTMSEQANRWQIMDAFELFQEPALSADIGALLPAEFAGSDFEHLRTKYININSRCLLDYDVVEFHASFKAPASFEPAWVRVKNTKPLIRSGASSELKLSGASENETLPIGGRAQTGAGSRPDVLKIPAFMRADVSDFHRHAVLVAQCDSSLAQLSFEAYRKCLRYRYWVVQKLQRHFSDWRRVISRNLKETFDLMDGNIRFRVNKCEATIKRIATIPRAFSESIDQTGEFPDLTLLRGSVEGHQQSGGPEPSLTATNQIHSSTSTSTSTSTSNNNNNNNNNQPNGGSEAKLLEMPANEFDPLDPFAKIDADLDCELTIHSASDDSGARQHARKVLLEKQLPRFIFSEHKLPADDTFQRLFDEGPAPQSADQSAEIGRHYYLMAPNTLIRRESFDQLGQHRKLFSPCKSDYAYCDKQTRCEMVDTVNYSCTCDYGYTPIGSRDIYFGDSRKEVCEDINECLFDVCKENGLENKSVCVNEVGDYKCQCTRHHVGDNKRYCNHICNVIACKYGDCRIPDEHHAFCECHEGYREADCSVLDPSVALRKANMIICGSIFTSVLLLAVTLAISLNSQLKKTKKKLKRLEAAQDAAEFLEFNLQQAPFSRQRVSKASIAS